MEIKFIPPPPTEGKVLIEMTEGEAKNLGEDMWMSRGQLGQSSNEFRSNLLRSINIKERK